MLIPLIFILSWPYKQPGTISHQDTRLLRFNFAEKNKIYLDPYVMSPIFFARFQQNLDIYGVLNSVVATTRTYMYGPELENSSFFAHIIPLGT